MGEQDFTAFKKAFFSSWQLGWSPDINGLTGTVGSAQWNRKIRRKYKGYSKWGFRKKKTKPTTMPLSNFLITRTFLNTRRTPQTESYLLPFAQVPLGDWPAHCEWRKSRNFAGKWQKSNHFHSPVEFISLWFAFSWLQAHEMVTEPCRSSIGFSQA